jgi:DNA primase catalytic subunit
VDYSEWRYVEVAKYVPKLNAVIREKRDNESVMLSGDEIDQYRKKYNNKGLYTSVFRYNAPSLEAQRISPLYFDLDAEAHLEIAHQDVRLLYQYLTHHIPDEIVDVYFSGSKGFHVEVSARALGVGPHMDLAKIFRLIAEQIKEELKIETFDFAVYEPRRMWRMPNSRHQKTGLYKVLLDESELFSDMETILGAGQSPRNHDTFEHGFSPKANEWLKYWLVKLDEIDLENLERARIRRVEMWKKHGSVIIDAPSKKYVKAVWKSAMKILQEAEPNKDRNITLSRQAYKLYITHLQADMDVEDVTNKLYDIGIGMGLEDREVRATLKSALRAASRKHEQEPRSHYEQQT